MGEGEGQTHANLPARSSEGGVRKEKDKDKDKDKEKEQQEEMEQQEEQQLQLRSVNPYSLSQHFTTMMHSRSLPCSRHATSTLGSSCLVLVFGQHALLMPGTCRPTTHISLRACERGAPGPRDSCLPQSGPNARHILPRREL